jgi:hypothetical protein
MSDTPIIIDPDKAVSDEEVDAPVTEDPGGADENQEESQ